MLVTLCAWPPLSAAQWVILSRFLHSFHSLPVCLAWLALSALLFLHFYVAGRRVCTVYRSFMSFHLMFICSTLHILLRFIHLKFFTSLCFALCLLRWHLQVHTFLQCIFWNEAMRCVREKNQQRASVIASIVQTMYFICLCVSFVPSIGTSAHTLCLHHQHCWTKPTTNKSASEKLHDEQKMGALPRESISERGRLGMTLLATVLCWLFICVLIFFKRNSLCMYVQLYSARPLGSLYLPFSIYRMHLCVYCVPYHKR